MKTTFPKDCHLREIRAPLLDGTTNYSNQKQVANSSDLAWHVLSNPLQNGSFSLDLRIVKINSNILENLKKSTTISPCKVLGTRILLIISRKETTITCKRCNSSAIFVANSSLLNNWTLTCTTRLLSVSGSEDPTSRRDIRA